jgi:hypothetical protein
MSGLTECEHVISLIVTVLMHNSQTVGGSYLRCYQGIKQEQYVTTAKQIIAMLEQHNLLIYHDDKKGDDAYER